MRSAWVCTRNDVLGNLAVAAALGVFGTGNWLARRTVAVIMAALALPLHRYRPFMVERACTRFQPTG